MINENKHRNTISLLALAIGVGLTVVGCSSLMGNIRIVEDFVEFDPSITYQLVICGLNTTATNAIKYLCKINYTHQVL